MAETDNVVRAITRDGAFRVIACNSTQTAAAIASAQNADAQLSEVLGSLTTAAVLYRETMAPSLRVQCMLQQGPSNLQLIADSHPEGWARGLIRGLPDNAATDKTYLQMMRTLPNGDLHRGIVEMSDGNLSEGLVRYLQQSEQVIAMVKLSTAVEEGVVQAASGWLVQLLPEAPTARRELEVIVERLTHLDEVESTMLDPDVTPRQMVQSLLAEVEFAWLNDSPLRFGCNCSEVRLLTGLATLPRAEIEEMVADGEPVHSTCDYCNTNYVLDTAKLQGLLSSS